MSAHAPGPWPALPYDGWAGTRDTLHMKLQILGKVRVALSEPEPEFADVALYVTARGISTGPVPSARGIFEVEADFFDHRVYVRTAWGEVHSVALTARPVAAFWTEFNSALVAAGIDVELPSMPQEVPDPIPFPDDTVHAEYDPGFARRFWEILTLVQPVLAEYRAAYRGRVSPVHFFWGHIDLAVTRFSGRPCDPPEHADFLDRGTYDAEQISIGWWAGDDTFPEPAFYAYSYPKGDGIEDAPLEPSAAFWSAELGEHLLRYDDVRTAPDPAVPIRAFLDGFFAAASMRCAWDPSLAVTAEPASG